MWRDQPFGVVWANNPASTGIFQVDVLCSGEET